MQSSRFVVLLAPFDIVVFSQFARLPPGLFVQVYQVDV